MTQATPLPEPLYRSANLEVRRIPAGDGRRQVVTFDSYHEPPGFDRPGFGEAFFEHEGITAVHVMCHDNDWFQYPEISHVLRQIRQVCGGAAQLLSYGSSMGGYAALRFAAAIGAHSALALSPQYSLDRRKAPFETRWASDRRRIRFLPALERRLSPVPLMILAYDPALEADHIHAMRLSAEAKVAIMPFPYSGHPAGAFLQDVGLLRPLVLDALAGRVDQDRYAEIARSRARRSPHWLSNVADHHPRAHGKRAVSLARRAVALAPDRPNLHDVLARSLASAGHYEEAIATHERAIAIDPIVDYYWGLSRTHFAAGKVQLALEVADRIRELAPRSAGYHAWAARLREASGDWGGAVADLRHAIRHDPTNIRYRLMTTHLQWRKLVERLRVVLRS